MTESLFDSGRTSDRSVPLAARMRPRALEEMVGQTEVLREGSMLRRALAADRLPSLLLVGPAGTGKTTLARIIASLSSSHFVQLSAVEAGVKDIREAAAAARDRRGLHDVGTVVFLDEIHRLNKAQQDYLLPHVEDGTFTLIGATTENPFFSIIRPLLSRCRLVTLKPLTPDDLQVLLRRALADEKRGLAYLKPQVPDEVIAYIAESAGGDARLSLGALEVAVQSASPEDDGSRAVTLELAKMALDRPVQKYDRAGDEHYDTISAFIKSIRGSDPDAAIYWLAKMLEGGEDARFIARRLVIAAAEDIGMADPTALRLAVAAADAVEYVGLPEAQIPLAQATIHLAAAPKSNSAYQAINAAREDVRREGGKKAPGHLAGGPRAGEEKAKYLYPHDFPGGWVRQSYWPAGEPARQYYEPGDNLRERRIAQRLAELRGEIAPGETPDGEPDADATDDSGGRDT
ncbi:MAG: replication-associated recombination protein A [candidate division WS1 bacterium]|jgi:putative ATPase|nr:replication-associated recombination protein A [candidate division WS1 bacterium]